MAEGEQKQKRTLRKLACRGGGLDPPLDAPCEQPMQLRSAPAAAAARGGSRARAAAAAQGREGRAARGEARGAEDAPARHEPSARDGGQRGWRLQRQDLQPGGNQA